VKNRQFHAKKFLVPPSVESQLIVSNHECAPLRFGQMPEHDHRHFFHARFPRGEKPGMPCDDTVIGVN
jgi:hypothetical protein